MDFRILGPVEVVGRDGPVPLGGAKQRALLAVLLLHDGEAVETERLVEELWGERPPATAIKTVQVYVSHLRRALGDGVLETRGRGYRLQVPDGDFDLDRFRRGLAEGRAQLAAGEPRQARETLGTALGEWRGPPLADLAYEPFATHRIAELEELRVAALEDRIEADLALGLHDEVIAELRELVRTHPLRERLTGQLMLALYRSGRQAEALECYQQTRQRLVDDLGLEPGPQLRELEASILNHDPALGGPRAARSVSAQERLRRSNGRRLIGAGAVLAGLAVAGGIAAVLSGEDSSSVRAVSGDGVVMIEPAGQTESIHLGLPGRPGGAAAGFGRLWLSDPRADRLVAVDPGGRRVAFVSSGGREPAGVAVTEDRIWTANSGDNQIAGIDPGQLTPVQTIDVGARPTAIVSSGNDLWVANSADGTVQHVDAFAGHADPPVAVGAAPVDVAIGLGSVWVVDAANGTVVQIDPRSHKVIATTPVGSAPRSVITAFGKVWVATPADGTVTRLDPASPQAQRRISVAGGPAALAATPTGIWTATERGQLVRIDPRTLAIARPRTLDSRATGLLADGRRLWALTTAGTHRGGALRVEDEDSPESLDPAEAFDEPSWAVLALTSDGLVSYRHEGRAAGALLVPDLATAIPVPADGGRSYRFQLRRGLRYADGHPVRASDVRRALERSLATRASPAAFFVSSLRGASACHPGRPCDLTQGVEADDRAGVVTFRLTRADPGFVYALALPFAFPVPPGTPPGPQGTPPPGTGPYRVAQYVPHKTATLVRNPAFRQWSADAQPDGLADRITITYGVSLARAAHDIDRGVADIGLPTTLPASASLRKLIAGFHGRLERSTASMTSGVFMNVREPPFDDVRVRRAVSFAIDRRRVVELAGGPTAAVPACQTLPPSIAGYRPYCPYGQGGLTGTAYAGPRLAQARRLIAASGAQGAPVVLHYLANLRGQGRYLAGVLRRLGFRTRLRLYPSAERYFTTISDSDQHVQIGFDAWGADYPAPADFLSVVFGCRGRRLHDPVDTPDPALYCNPEVDRRVADVERLALDDPARAALAWSGIDRTVTDDAPWAQLYNVVALDLVGRRVGGYARNPHLGPLLGMVSLR